jgi:hypothetical protein
MSYEAERAKILEMIQQGTISPEEALQLLNAMQGSDDYAGNGYTDYGLELDADEHTDESAAGYPEEEPLPQPVVGEVVRPVEGVPDVSADIRKWKNWWMIPFWGSVGITTLGGLLMFLAYQANGFSFWFACSLFLFLTGAGLMALFVGSRNVPWLHIRVNTGKDESPRRIALSFPLPLRLAAWFLRIFRERIPGMDTPDGLDTLIMMLKDGTSPETPFFVNVVDDDDRKSVQVFIG